MIGIFEDEHEDDSSNSDFRLLGIPESAPIKGDRFQANNLYRGNPHDAKTSSSSLPSGSGLGRSHDVSIMTWRPSVEDRSNASSTSSTCIASSPLARCGRLSRTAAAISSRPTMR